MSATPSPSQSIPADHGDTLPLVSAREIDASCRVPVIWLFLNAAFWLILSSLFSLIATLNFHSVHFLADCAWFTYGRVHPAATSLFVYGFAAQAGLGVALWLLAHLGRTRLVLLPAVFAGIIIWNLGMWLGLIGILYGDSTGFEWLELPRYSSVMLFIAFAFIGVAAMVTLHIRREKPLYISQWFILGALFWFPWIFSTANILLIGKPVRGALQAGIDWWYANNLMFVWLPFLGLAAIFYFIPKIVRRPFQSHYAGILIFWTLSLFASCAGVPAGTPLPAWMSALSTFAAILTIVPIIAVAWCVRHTFDGDCSAVRENRTLKFFLFGTVAYIVAGLSGAATSLLQVSKVTGFTWFVPAQTQLLLFGFFAMVMFGAIYYIVAQLLQTEFCKPGLICLHFGLAALGIVIYSASLGIGGVIQGTMLNDPSQSFLVVMEKTLIFLRVSTLGELLMILGNLVLLINLFGILLRVGKKSATEAWQTNTKRAEVVW